jgi:hypothetical protein
VPQKVIDNFGWQGLRHWRVAGPGCDKGSCRNEGASRGYTTDRVPLTEAIYVPAMADAFLESGLTVYDLLARAEKMEGQTFRRSAKFMLDVDQHHGGLTTWEKIRANIQEDMFSFRQFKKLKLA